MKIKIKKDKIIEQICKDYTYDFEEYITFEEHILEDNILPKYNIGLIIGSSGSGKSILLKTFGEEESFKWDTDKAIASHFDSYDEAIEKLMGCGLNSIPSWLKPYRALSNGQQYRADLAVSIKDNCIKDEFTSVVDRGTALSLANSIEKMIRKENYKNVVFASVHKDIIPYLKPDWVYDTDLRKFIVNSNIWELEDLDNKVFKKHFMEITK